MNAIVNLHSIVRRGRSRIMSADERLRGSQPQVLLRLFDWFMRGVMGEIKPLSGRSSGLRSVPAGSDTGQAE